MQTLDNGPLVYRFLNDLGFQTTKSVWPIKGQSNPIIGGKTCEDTAYRNWIKELHNLNFEIALHNVTFHTSRREEISRGLDIFYHYFGTNPKIHANHAGCNDAIYWGDARLNGIHKRIYNVLTSFRNRNKYSGHLEYSELFWGDLCKQKIKYVRNFVFNDINTLKRCTFMPYHDPLKPYVNFWFTSSDGSNVDRFNKCIQEKNQDRLEAEGGACIMYTHFAFGFIKNGTLDYRYKELMTRLSKKKGWFVPVGTMLDYLLEKNNHHIISNRERNQLERRWLFEKIFKGTT